MKINLLFNNPYDVRSGYLNIDPYAGPNDQAGRIPGDINNLDDLVSAGEATEVVALDILDKFPRQYVDQILTHWLSRLAHGGRLTISVIDLYEVAKAFLNEAIDVDKTNTLLHGDPETKGKQVHTNFTLAQLNEVLTNKGFKVLRRCVENNYAIITVERP